MDSSLRRSASGGGRPRVGVPVNDASEVGALADAGADLFYFGFRPGLETGALGSWALENGRDTPGSSLGTIDAVAALVREVHARGRMLSLAMNRPYPSAVRRHIEAAVAEAAEAGVDGFILGDLDLLEFVRRRWPDRGLTASTFLGIHNRPGLDEAARLGFGRVVLPRAMRLDEIAGLARGSGPELEVFVARERCRFVNAYCRLEHALPDPADPGRLRFPASPLCMQPLVDADGDEFRIEDGDDSLEACGLCAVDALRDVPRVGAFKIVGRGTRLDLRIRWVRLLRRVVDGEVRGFGAVQDAVLSQGLRCSPATCHYPPPRETARPRSRVRDVRRPPGFRFPDGLPADRAIEVIADVGSIDFRRETGLPEGIAALRIGHESCQHLLPEPAGVRRLLQRSGASEGRIDLVLPPLFGGSTVAKALVLAGILVESGRFLPRVTVNDIGTLAALRDAFGPRVEVSLGRNLAGQRVDPRLLRHPDDPGGSALASALARAHLRVVARIANADRIELSLAGRLPDADDLPVGRVTLHLGPSLAAVSRACHVLADREFRETGSRAFRIPSACDRPCLGADRELHASGGSETFLSRGNAMYGVIGVPGILPGYVDRVVAGVSTTAPSRPRGRPAP